MLLGYDLDAQCGAQNCTDEMHKSYPSSFGTRFASLDVERDKGSRMSGGSYTIPVVWHVFRSTTQGNLTQSQINAAIANLNTKFAGTQITFKLAKIDPQGNCTDGITYNTTSTPYGSLNIAMEYLNLKGVIQWDNSKYLNIYSVAGMVTNNNTTFDSGTEGYAFLPCVPNVTNPYSGFSCNIAGSSGSWDQSDGVVLRYNLTEILPHEVGHYLGLFHTWGPSSFSSQMPWWTECGGPCDKNGDFICDTNPMLRNTAYTNCTNNTCDPTDGLPDPTNNYMSYTKVCWSQFSSNQITRMKSILDVQRPLIHNSSNILATGVDNFVANSEITSTTTWTTSNLPNGGNVRSGNINVYNGATLNINSGVIVTMCKNSKIIVHPGGRLNLNGTVQSDISGDWDGILVHGSTSTQTFGIVSCGSPAKVINAKIGIESVNNNNLSGGRISASNTEFKNNTRSIKATSNFIDSYSAGSFSNCNFNNNIVGFINFVELYRILNTSFTSCTFANNYSQGSIGQNGIGIFARSSLFKVGEQYLINGVANGGTFFGLDYGIRVESPVSNKSYNIAHAVFNRCTYGVYNLSTNGGKIVYNTFNLQLSSVNQNRYGVYIDGLNNSLSIQENNFNGSTNISGGIKTVGVYHNNTLTVDKYVRRNTFTTVNYACQATNQNANSSGPGTGLRYTCNTFASGEKDIFPSITTNSVIHKVQKAFQLEPDLYIVGLFNIVDKVAGNKFNGSSFSGYRSIDNQMSIPVSYWHRNGFNEIPINSFNTTPVAFNDHYCPVEEANSYEIPLGNLGIPIPKTESELNAEYDKTKINIDLLNDEMDLNSTNWDSNQLLNHQNKIINLEHYLSVINLKLIDVMLNSEAYPNNLEDVYIKIVRENKYGTDLWLLKEYVAMADWTRAEAILQKISTQYTGNDESADIASVTSLFQILKGKSVLTASDINSIISIADSYTGNGAHWGQTILTGYGYLYHPIIDRDIIKRPSLSLTQYQVSDGDIEIYPNPATTELNVNIKRKVNNATITVQNMTGLTLLSKISVVGINQVDIQSLNTGMYIITVKDDSGVLQTYKFIKN